ncbi:MAG: ribosome-associated translation inhibitor RaiA [Oscillospiraceae bacterium]|jgi:putative sigma-54 modulation protein|nr:ribosome-associated translation inhibitor RaiA [Oscillospiraceae bacterium]
MKFTITEKKLRVSDEIKQYAERKLGKIDKFFKGEAEAFLTFGAERGRYSAEVTIENNGTYYRVSESTHDMRATIDSAVAAIERQIRKNKTRLEKRLREGVFDKDAGAAEFDDTPEERDFEIIRAKKFPIKPMTIEEAILQMNLLEHEFFAFKDQDNGNAFSVVYRRKSGGYGLISDV